MAQGFSLETGQRLGRRGKGKRSVLITGAAGTIGSAFAAAAHKRYRLRLMVSGEEDPKSIQRLRRYGEMVECHLGDLDRLKHHCRGIDTVLHLAAQANPSATWDSILANNITGTYHAFVAAKTARCRRLVFASSIHAVSGYPADYQVHTTDPVNPGDLYGVSKCFGEAMGRYMAEQEGLDTICIRIGAFNPARRAARSRQVSPMLDAFVSDHDLFQLFERCIEDLTLRFAIFHGLSDNRFKRLDITDARELVNYRPRNDLSLLNPVLRKVGLTNRAHSLSDAGQRSGLRNDLQPPRRRTRP